MRFLPRRECGAIIIVPNTNQTDPVRETTE